MFTLPQKKVHKCHLMNIDGKVHYVFINPSTKGALM